MTSPISSMEVESGDDGVTPTNATPPVQKRRFPRSLIFLFFVGIAAFSALAILLRMPKPDNLDPQSSPFTLRNSSSSQSPSVQKVDDAQSRKNSKGPLSNDVCRTKSCLKTAYLLLDAMNASVDPCDDFFEYSCGGWINKNPIPPHVSKWSHFGKLDSDTNKIIREILTEPIRSGDPVMLNQAKDFYKACSNVDELDRAGLEPVLKMLDNYGGWPILFAPGKWNPEKFDWMKSMADLKRLFGTSSIFDIQVNQNIASPSYSTIHLLQPSLFLSRPYLLNKVKYSSYILAYRDFIVNIAKELKASPGINKFRNESSGEGPTSAANLSYLREKADDIINFEYQIANLSKDGVTVQYGLRNATATVTLRFLQTVYDNYTSENSTHQFIMKKIFEYAFQSSGIQLNEAQLVSMGDVNYMGGIFEIVTNTSPETLANYLHFRMLGWVVSGTTKAMRRHVATYHQQTYGLLGSSPREYVCASSTEEKYGLALARKYLEKAKIDHNSVKQVSQIMEQVRLSFYNLLDSAAWMNATIRRSLRSKASSISSCIGFAPWMLPEGENASTDDTYDKHLKKHYQGLDISRGNTYLEKLWIVRQWLSDQKFKLLNEKFVPGCKWTNFPGQIGAFYDIRRKAVTIPLGVLQPPFFYADSPRAINFGGVGSIIGHEFTHGFTVNGWTEEEDGSFSKIGKCFVDQYSKYKVSKDLDYINGALTFDENFPDNGGLIESYHTYKKFSETNRVDEKLPGLENYSQDQLFFLGFSNIWCASSRPKGYLDQVLQDHHTPNRYRVIGTLQNSEEFASAWNCPLGSTMNPTKHKKYATTGNFPMSIKEH